MYRETFSYAFMYGKPSVCVFLEGNKCEKVNQKPNVSSCLTFSEDVLEEVWYQSNLGLSLFKTACPISEF